MLVVYADIILITNFVLDYAILQTTAWTRNIVVRPLKIMIAASIGAVYALLMFFPSFAFLFSMLFKIVFSFAMIFICFRYISLQYFIRNVGVFFAIQFITAGAIYGVHSILFSQNEIVNGILISQTGSDWQQLGPSLPFVFIVFGLAIVLYKLVFQSVKRKQAEVQYYADVEVWIDDNTTACKGLIDTGNRLYDPLTRTPVMVMELSMWSEVFPESWKERVRSIDTSTMMDFIDEENCKWSHRLRFIPYRGVNRETQFMLALKPDRVVIYRDQQKTEVNKVLIGLDAGTLCAEGSYQAIIHPALLQTLNETN